MTLEDIDLLDLDKWEENVPYDWFDRLRTEDPIHPQTSPSGTVFWSLTRYADVVEVSRDTRRFSSALTGVGIAPMTEQVPGISDMMHLTDPPHHTRLRKLVSRAFTPRTVAPLEHAVREHVRSAVAAVSDQGKCDFVHDIAAEVPLLVICELLGIPVSDRGLILDWTNRMMGAEDPEYAAGPEDAMQAAIEMWGYANELGNSRRTSPSNDVISLLLGDDDTGSDALTPGEFDGFFQLLAAAGNETSRTLISGGMLALIGHPDAVAEIRQNPSSLSTAVEEMLRWTTPVHHFARTVVADTTIGGRTVRRGDRVILWYSAANRDPAVFAEAEVFDILRSPNPHVSFGGGGAHFCLGANLARMEARTVFDELFSLLPDLELDGPVERMRSNMFNGIKHLPVRWTKG